MTALDDLKTYLTSTLSAKYTDEVLTSVLDTEILDQSSRLRPAHRMANPATDWATHPAVLREAVCRRACRNLAMRRLPLGISEGEVASLRVAGRDIEIRRLEGPYLRMAVG